MAHAFDVAVIGGGIVGASIAYGLLRCGRRVALLDEGDLDFRASRANLGLVWVQGKGLGMAPYVNWTQRAARLWPQLARELLDETGIDVSLEQPGGFHVCLSAAEMDNCVAAMTQIAAQAGVEPYAFEVLDRAALAERLPGLGPTVAGATFCALDGHANPLRLLYALHTAVHRRGGVYLPRHRVEAIERDAAGFTLGCAGARISAGQVVLGAGLGNAALAPLVGLRAPLRPQRGQILVLERLPRFLRHPLTTLRQTDTGTVLIGNSQQDVGFDAMLDLGVATVLAERAQRIFPALRAARVVRAWAGLRVMAPDAFPIYQQSASHPGAFIVTCHSGVTLASAHVADLAPRIAAGELGDSMRAFSAERFDVQTAA